MTTTTEWTLLGLSYIATGCAALATYAWWNVRSELKAARRRIAYLDRRHRTDKAYIATYLAELDAVTLCPAPVPGWAERTRSSINALPETGERDG